MTIGLNHDRADHIVGSAPGASDRRVRPWLIGVVALAVIGAFCGIVWYAYSQGISQGQRGGGVPLLRADATPARERPAEPGGIKVPHQDKLVYDQVGRAPPQAPAAERILPPPEQPMTRPVAPPPVAAAPPSTAPLPSIAPPSVMPAAPPTARAPSPAAPAPAAPAPAPPAARVPAPTPPLAAPPAPLAPPAPAPSNQTARLPAPPPTPPAATAPEPSTAPTSGGGGFRVQLAAVRESAAAQREWEKIKAAHPDVLGRLGANVVRVDLGEPRGVFFRIQAGPFGDSEAARRACTALKERNVGCLVVRP